MHNIHHSCFMRLHHPSTSPSCIILDRSSFATRDCKQPATECALAPNRRTHWSGELGFFALHHAAAASSEKPKSLLLCTFLDLLLSTHSIAHYHKKRLQLPIRSARPEDGCSSSLFLYRVLKMRRE